MRACRRATRRREDGPRADAGIPLSEFIERDMIGTSVSDRRAGRFASGKFLGRVSLMRDGGNRQRRWR